jgi:hypothetical protein
MFGTVPMGLRTGLFTGPQASAHRPTQGGYAMSGFVKKLTHNWQNSLSLILGLWFFVSPWVLDFSAVEIAMWNAAIVGLVIAMMALMTLVEFHDFEEWADMVVGAWLVISPWLLGFVDPEGVVAAGSATWNTVIIGVLVLGLALWSLLDHHEGARA